MERRFTNQPAAGVRVRQEGDGPAVIEGVGAVFYDGTPETQFELWPGAVERIMPGAFDRAVRDDDVRGLFNHNPDNVLGRTAAGTMRLSTDSKGLRYSIDQPDTTIGRDTAEVIRRGDVKGSSFSFQVGEEEWRREELDGGHTLEIREIREVDPLFDVGPVTFPAYSATTTGVRSADTPEEARVSYDAWRARQAEQRRFKARVKIKARLAEIDSDQG